MDYLSEGLLPDGDYAGGLMTDVIEDGLSHLTPEDLNAPGKPDKQAGTARASGFEEDSRWLCRLCQLCQ